MNFARGTSAAGKGTIVGVCSDPDVACDDAELTPADLAVFRARVGRLAGALSRLLGCEPDLRPLPFVDGTWCIGWYEPSRASDSPSAWRFRPPENKAHSAAVRLVGHLGRRFILLVPARDVVDPETIEYLRGHRACLLFLEEILTVDAIHWYLRRPAEDILRDFRGSVLDHPRLSVPTLRFPPCSGARWQNVTIRFLTEHQVHVQVGRPRWAFDFTQLGMPDGRKNPVEPDKQWRLLVDFAEGDGIVRWGGTNENRKRQKHKEELSKPLRAFFGIGDDPFEPLEDHRGWRANFRVVAGVVAQPLRKFALVPRFFLPSPRPPPGP